MRPAGLILTASSSSLADLSCFLSLTAERSLSDDQTKGVKLNFDVVMRPHEDTHRNNYLGPQPSPAIRPGQASH